MKKYNYLPKMLFYIILTYPLLDIIYSINYRILHMSIPINQGIRILILIYLFSKVKSAKTMFFLWLFTFLLIISEISHLYFGIIDLVDDISYLTKLLFFLVSIYGSYEIMKNENIDPLNVMKTLVVSSLVISISLILSKFGLGMESWGEDSVRSGVRGLFTVPNTINVTLLIIMPLCLLLFNQTNLKRYFVYYGVIFISLLLIGTKSGLVGAVLITVSQIIYLLFKTKLSYLKMTVTAFSIPIIMVIAFFMRGYVNSFITQQKYVYDLHGYNNFFSFLISNRDLQVRYIQRFLDNFSEWNPASLLGIGYSLSNDILNTGKAEFKALEMDFHGIYYYSGWVVLLIIIFVILIRYISAIKLFLNTKFDFYSFSILLSLTVGIVHAYLGGHVIYEALTSLYFGFLLSIAKLRHEHIKLSSQEKNDKHLSLRRKKRVA